MTETMLLLTRLVDCLHHLTQRSEANNWEESQSHRRAPPRRSVIVQSLASTERPSVLPSFISIYQFRFRDGVLLYNLEEVGLRNPLEAIGSMIPLNIEEIWAPSPGTDLGSAPRYSFG